MDGDEIRFALVTNIEPSFSRSTRKRCFRVGGKHGTRLDSLPLKTVQLVAPGERGWQKAQVYLVNISPSLRQRWPKQPAAYYVVALDWVAVANYLGKRYANIAHNHMGTAQVALGKAMAAVSTRPKIGRAGKHAEAVAEREVHVVGRGGDEDYTVRIDDNLVYAVEALKDGRASIDTAVKLAANRVAGRLRHFGDHLLDPTLQTPFPEVKRKGARRVA